MSNESTDVSRPSRVVPWWRRPWVVPLWLICAAFLAWRTPAYLGLTPEASLVVLRSHAHYLMLSAHVILGTVALAACCLQVWPWLRRHHPQLHMITGRVYLAVVLPGALLALVSAALQDVPVPGKIGNAALAILWLITTVHGFVAIRRGRVVDHRRWMIRSFALCFSIVLNRVWTAVMMVVLLPFLDGYYGGDVGALFLDAAIAAIWLSWVVNLIAAEWWMQRRRRPARIVGPPRRADGAAE